MSSWFGYGSGESNKKGGVKEKASLMAHDEMEDRPNASPEIFTSIAMGSALHWLQSNDAKKDFNLDDTRNSITTEQDEDGGRRPKPMKITNDIKYSLLPIHNPYAFDASAPWATTPDEKSEEGRGPSLPDYLYSQANKEAEAPKGTVMALCFFNIYRSARFYIGYSSCPRTASGRSCSSASDRLPPQRTSQPTNLA